MSELFPFQKTGAEWLSGLKVALLADEMGLGKSAQAITAADDIGALRILVLCPAAARINWFREFQKFAVLPRVFEIITKRDQGKIDKRASVICSYDLTLSNKEGLSGFWDILILDESHFLKGLNTQRTHAVFGKEGLVRQATRIWALSGTPAPNNISELWPLLYTFGVTELPYYKFVEQYCEGYLAPQGFRVTGTKPAKIPELKALINTVMLRRKKEDVMKELPEIFYTDIVVEPGKVDLRAESSFDQYVWPVDRTAELAEILKKGEALINGAIEATGLGRDGMKMLEAMATSISTLRRYTGLQKVEGVVDLVKGELESKAYEKIVLFAIHRDVIEGLRSRLAAFGPVTLYGGTDPDKKQRNIDKFQNNPNTRVFIGNIQAAGTAITLTAAHHVLFVEQDWVPGNNAQAAMRCHRIGQTKPVTVRVAGLAGSFDEKIAAVLRRKMKDLIALFDGIDSRGLQTAVSDDSTPKFAAE